KRRKSMLGAPFKLNKALVCRAIRHAGVTLHDAWHVRDFARPAARRAIDIDPNSVRLAAARLPRNSNGGMPMGIVKLGGALFCAALAVIAAVATASAQDAAANYPSKPIRVIVP